MKPYQERVVNEMKELDEKRVKLELFTGSEIFPTLPKAEQERLKLQIVTMTLYSMILGQRIDAFV